MQNVPGLKAPVSKAQENKIDEPGSPNDPGLARLLTADEAVAIAGVSRVTLGIKTKEGVLHPVKQGHRVYYHPHEIQNLRDTMIAKREVRGLSQAKVPRTAVPVRTAPLLPPQPPSKTSAATITYQGEVAAKATKLFNADKGVREVVAELEITYELAEHLYDRWKQAGPELHLSPKQVALLANRFNWHDSPPSVEGLLRAINRFLESEVTRAVKEALADVQKQAEAAVAAQKNGKAATVAPIGTEQEIPDAERALIEAAEREAALDDEADEPPKP
jgi:hypothetical protein